MLFTWQNVYPTSQVDYYEVMRSANAQGPFDTSVGTASGYINGLEVDIDSQPLPPGGVWYYKVRAVKGTCVGPLAP